MATLSIASDYEQLFGVRHRGAGRPLGDVAPVFVDPVGDTDPLLLAVAKRRAYAVVHEEQKERLAELFRKELKVLRRRGVEVVAADTGVALKLAGVKDEDIPDAVDNVLRLNGR